MGNLPFATIDAESFSNSFEGGALGLFENLGASTISVYYFIFITKRFEAF
jgi:hypothetical protein